MQEQHAYTGLRNGSQHSYVLSIPTYLGALNTLSDTMLWTACSPGSTGLLQLPLHPALLSGQLPAIKTLFGRGVPLGPFRGTSCPCSCPDTWDGPLPPCDTRSLCFHQICKEQDSYQTCRQGAQCLRTAIASNRDSGRLHLHQDLSVVEDRRDSQEPLDTFHHLHRV